MTRPTYFDRAGQLWLTSGTYSDTLFLIVASMPDPLVGASHRVVWHCRHPMSARLMPKTLSEDDIMLSRSWRRIG